MLKLILKQPLWRLALVGVLAAAGLYYFWGRKATTNGGTLFTAKRGPMQISVLEGGSVEALESQEIRSQIKGYQGTKILSIVEEGYLVSDDDIKNGKILVELDSSDLKQRITTEEIQFQSTLSSLIEATNAYEIQYGQNISDLKAAELKVRFALMDFEKFVGDKNTKEITTLLGLKEPSYEIDFEKAEQEAEDLFPSAVGTVSMMPQALTEAAVMMPPNGMVPANFNVGDRRAGGPPSDRRFDEARANRPPDSTQTNRRPDRMQGERRPQGARTDRQAGGSPDGQRPKDIPGDRPPNFTMPMPQGGGDPSAMMARPPMGSPMTLMTAPGQTNALFPSPMANLPRPLGKVPGLTNSVRRLALTNAIINWSKYADTNKLGDGSAQQQLRKMIDDLETANQTLGLDETHLAGTKRLLDQTFVTKNEYDVEVNKVQQDKLRVKTAQTAYDLFIKYEFGRSAEDFLSKYDESLRSYDRARKEAISKLAQARARLKSAEGRYRIEMDQRAELFEQYSNCVIRAKRPGLVVYGGSGGGDRRFFGNEEPIREGATVRERQSIITIPDMTRMSVKVKIHESHIKKVKKGQKARIQVDAFPDEKLMGEVIKVAVLPDSTDRFMNPDMKVYGTSIAVDGAREWLKPGMSAKVEILIKELTDVVHIPIQAVFPIKGKQYAFVGNGRGPEQREIEVGEFNDEFIEVRKGLKAGEKVVLRAPEGTESDLIETQNNAEGEAAPSSPTAVPGGAPVPAKVNPARPAREGAVNPAGGPSGPRPNRSRGE